MATQAEFEMQPMTPEQEAALKRQRRRRSIALGAALALFALTFYVLTIVKMGPALFDRAL
ncbi:MULTISPECIES: hypothetical protein [Devosia]|uniref:CoxF protein n=1 Tax=Devosia equisanguinis TaxID=2490941 RepID=A0A3S4GIY8_9HYPH|nr:MULTISPECIES: hypothetical protein [Devosia]ODT47554.1 MAG: hypothetical protein ABS74_14950 [Pelagibacterium sp. SCN 63-126]ODU86365.1 MAG: hypothetical protein ABT14_08860 [Pelagibacterium sp. SCN 63-17]OJX43658.1 MAG: hypothetical protein BGO80_14915 [Devosia sp. 63-57]VDS04089.1 hypothetical protein DEVEQU_01220 [Devosia equisanguinis]